MINKLSTGILTAVAMALFAAPVASNAASSAQTSAQIKKLSKKLNKLPNEGAPANVVTQYVTKLAKLDPKKAKKYYSTGLKKLTVNFISRANANKIAADLRKILKKSGLSDSQISKIVKQITKVYKNYDPQPPYQASISSGWTASVA
jgi:DNA-directed RNA polymerase subunit F